MQSIAIIPNDPLQLTPEIQSLVELVRLEIESGLERARLAMEGEKRQTYWNVGQHIKEHLLKNASRADYGAQLFPILVQNLKIDQSTLYRSVQFYEEYPEIVALRRQLTWTHIRTLLPIGDLKLRKEYEDKIIKEKLTVDDLKALIKKNKGLIEASSKTQILSVSRGVPWVYRLRKDNDKIVVDLGFHFFIESPLQDITTDSVMKVEKQNKQYKFNNTDTGDVPYYTYKAFVLEVIDGDTLWVKIDLGFDTGTIQKIRLRGINAMEIESESGKSAKDYIEKKLKDCKFIVVKTYWRDKFTRYLADVFYPSSSKDYAATGSKNVTDYETVIQTGTFLNQELLDKGLAVKY